MVLYKYYYFLFLTVDIVIVLLAAWHALLFKRDPRASLGWIAVIVLFPIMGPLLYFLLGINRIKTSAQKLSYNSALERIGFIGSSDDIQPLKETRMIPERYAALANISNLITRRSLSENNRIEILHNGENAYPAMLGSIESARESIYLSTYIFDTSRTGKAFIDGLAGAHERGVDVRVIIDGIGEYYSFPRAVKLLQKRGIRTVRFIPPGLIPPSVHLNLRNHRKILVVDGKDAFVGGMNIREGHLAHTAEAGSKVIDVHFRLNGPVVSQVQDVFAEDWNFVTKENFSPVSNHQEGGPEGSAVCRVITHGPNEDMDKLAFILAGAITSAVSRVMIMTPYFLPTRDIISALQIASLRGVRVDILLPQKSNIPFVHWATRNMLWELLQKGVNVYYQPPPFVHSKLLVVDDHYAHVGTANMDPRSLRLNFELVVEIYDEPFVRSMAEHIYASIDKSRKISLKEVDSRKLPARTRDSLAWLFYSYL